MAYVIINSGTGEEVTRRELNGPITIGRSPDCDVSVHDILLSRKHCKLEPTDEKSIGTGWWIVDLASKNGTRINDRRIDRETIKDGEWIQVGKTRITFKTGLLIPAPTRFQRPRTPIPADPNEALAGTVSGFEYAEPCAPAAISIGLPVPRPRPKDPDSFSTDDVYSMLEGIASSSWDSIYEINARPLRKGRALPRPMIRGPHTTINMTRPRRPELSMVLQAGIAMPAPVLKQTLPIPRRIPTRDTFTRRTRLRLARMSRWMTRTGYLRLF